ncbi:MAG TPA: NADH-quinone oxidoreductase subunit A [Thermoanaerobaculaceae bacterium]|nr:NADH-quinone oxidoreductase subunit A [Thermoanaerobaculaceae bacterium]HRS17071.1 NADH-quinone oxidoreductase subunit A [Thermoanaerobaculaceae bacterium]
MLGQYIPVLMAIGFAAAVAGGMIGLSALLGRGRVAYQRKTETYESGMPPLDSAHKRVPVRFFIVAMVFIVFDVEVAFLFPWAVAARDVARSQPTTVLAVGFTFLAVLAIGFAYLWREGAFDWARREKA